MKCLERNKSEIYICFYQGKCELTDSEGFDTGEVEHTYTAPLPIKACVSSAHGNAQIQMFGLQLEYDKTITFDDVNLPITEAALFFIDKPPKYDYESHTLQNKDYVVKAVSKSLNVITVAVQKVNDDEVEKQRIF